MDPQDDGDPDPQEDGDPEPLHCRIIKCRTLLNKKVNYCEFVDNHLLIFALRKRNTAKYWEKSQK